MKFETLVSLIDKQTDMLSDEMDAWGSNKTKAQDPVKEIREKFSRWVIELQKIETLELLRDAMESEL